MDQEVGVRMGVLVLAVMGLFIVLASNLCTSALLRDFMLNELCTTNIIC